MEFLPLLFFVALLAFFIFPAKNRAKIKGRIGEISVASRQKAKNQICPKCSNELKLRSGKYGKFYGCSDYPYCKFTMKLYRFLGKCI